MTCDHCQKHLLPYLYDLLESEERTGFVAHLESCPECQTGLKSAQAQQSLLAQAVKEAHPEIVFKAPIKATPASSAPTVMMFKPSRRFVLLNRWSAAAAILFVLFSAGSVIGWTVWRDGIDSVAANKDRLAKAKSELEKAQEQHQQKKAQNQKEIRAIQEQIDALFNDWKTKETQTRKAIEDKRAESRINVYGPQVAQAGAATRYEIERNALANFEPALPGGRGKGGQQQDLQPGTRSPSQARVVNSKTGETLYQQKLEYQANNRANFDMPALPIKPGDDLVIVFDAKEPDGKLVALGDNLKIVFPEYVTHLATDRPLYRPGDTVRFRSLTLERFSLKPAQQSFHLRYRILGPKNDEIFRKEVASRLVAGPKNEPIRGPDGAELHGLGVGDFTLPADLPVGQYTLLVSEVNERFNEEKRSFLVQRWQQARFRKELTFHRTSYGAGDQIKMQARVAPIQPGLQPRQISAYVVIDGQKVFDQPLSIDQDGKASFECGVPVLLPRGVGKVMLECGTDEFPETLVREIPLVVRELQVEFYPEGGDLIAGAPNRVYFQARTLANKPADIEGRIVDEKDQEVARVQTVSDPAEPGINQGLGFFTFVPQAKKRYKLIIDSPLGIDRATSLPEVKDQGVVMTIPESVIENEIDVLLQSTQQRRELLVGAYCRGRMIDHQFVRAGVNQPVQATLKPALGIGGVYRVTVFELIRTPQDIIHRPIAERLIYRKSSEKVDVEIKSDRDGYQPGDAVRLSLAARNEKKVLVPSVALVGIFNNSIARRADEKAARTMPTHFLLTTEVRNPEDLEYADFLLGDHPQAAQSLDLLLGCQGWRRFAEQDPQMFVRQQQPGKLQGLLNNTVNPVAHFVGADQKEMESLDQNFVKQAIELQKKLGSTEQEETAPNDQQRAVESSLALMASERLRVEEAERQLRETSRHLVQFGLGGALLTLLFLGFFFVNVGLRRLSEGAGRPRTWFTAGLGLLGFLFIASVVGTIAFMGENQFDHRKGDPALWGGAAAEKKLAAPVIGPIAAPEDLLPDDAEDVQKLAQVADEKNKRREPAPNASNMKKQPEAQKHLVNDLPMKGMQPPPEQQDRQWREEGNYQALLLKNVGRRVQMPAVNQPSVIREFAQRRQPNKDEAHAAGGGTIYWHPVLIMPNGKAEVAFDLPDSVARYQVVVLSHTLDGRLGANRAELASELPFTFKPHAPVEISSRDQITVPITLQNTTARATAGQLQALGTGLEFIGKQARESSLPVGQSMRELFQIKPTITEGIASLRVTGKSAGFGNTIERRFKVVPEGVVFTRSISGLIDAGVVEHTIDLPAQWNPGTVQVQAHFYPSPIAELAGAIEALQREPTGCFEPTASSLALNAQLLQFLKATKQANPTLEKQARQALASSLHRMAEFECLDPDRSGEMRGYEWFGQAALPHAALTAYAMMVLRDSAKVVAMDDDLLRRTEQCVLAQRDVKKRTGTGQPPTPVANAYILWAKTECGIKVNVEKDLLGLREEARTNQDPYYLALAALSHLNAKKTQEGVELLRTVVASQKPDGMVSGAKTSITGSRGRDLDIETTSLAVLGWLKVGKNLEFSQNLHNGVQWLQRQRQGTGAYGSTQATSLTLKALIAYYHENPRMLDPGEVSLSVASGAPGQERFGVPDDIDTDNMIRSSFSTRSQDMLTLRLPTEQRLRPGKNVIRLNLNGRNAMPYTLTWSYRTTVLPAGPKTPLEITAKLNSTQATEGETVKLTAVLKNYSGMGQGLTVAILGLPAGLSLPDDAPQLKALVEGNGPIRRWELRGRELVLYCSDLAPNGAVKVDLDLVCHFPGRFSGPASRAYAYYDGEHKSWTEPLVIRIDSAK